MSFVRRVTVARAPQLAGCIVRAKKNQPAVT